MRIFLSCTQTFMTSPFNIQEKLKIYFPILFELLNNNKIDWKMVEKTFFRKYEQYQKKHIKINSSFQIEASFYSIITAAIKREKPFAFVGVLHQQIYLSIPFIQKMPFSIIV